MVAAVGFIMIIVIVALLLKGKMSPIVVLVVVPAIAALILGLLAHEDSAGQQWYLDNGILDEIKAAEA
jgi:Mg2+/citrate symporter